MSIWFCIWAQVVHPGHPDLFWNTLHDASSVFALYPNKTVSSHSRHAIYASLGHMYTACIRSCECYKAISHRPLNRPVHQNSSRKHLPIIPHWKRHFNRRRSLNATAIFFSCTRTVPQVKGTRFVEVQVFNEHGSFPLGQVSQASTSWQVSQYRRGGQGAATKSDAGGEREGRTRYYYIHPVRIRKKVCKKEEKKEGRVFLDE